MYQMKDEHIWNIFRPVVQVLECAIHYIFIPEHIKSYDFHTLENYVISYSYC